MKMNVYASQLERIQFQENNSGGVGKLNQSINFFPPIKITPNSVKSLKISLPQSTPRKSSNRSSSTQNHPSKHPIQPNQRRHSPSTPQRPLSSNLTFFKHSKCSSINNKWICNLCSNSYFFSNKCRHWFNDLISSCLCFNKLIMNNKCSSNFIALKWPTRHSRPS